jgi:hypothetical protein
VRSDDLEAKHAPKAGLRQAALETVAKWNPIKKAKRPAKAAPGVNNHTGRYRYDRCTAFADVDDAVQFELIGRNL